MPGAPPGYLPQPPQHPQADIDARIVEAKETVDDLVALLSERAGSAVADAVAARTELGGAMEGAHANLVADVTATANKLAEKMAGRALGRLTEAISLAQSLGYDLPPPSDLVSGDTTLPEIPLPPAKPPEQPPLVPLDDTPFPEKPGPTTVQPQPPQPPQPPTVDFPPPVGCVPIQIQQCNSKFNGGWVTHPNEITGSLGPGEVECVTPLLSAASGGSNPPNFTEWRCLSIPSCYITSELWQNWHGTWVSFWVPDGWILAGITGNPTLCAIDPSKPYTQACWSPIAEQVECGPIGPQPPDGPPKPPGDKPPQPPTGPDKCPVVIDDLCGEGAKPELPPIRPGAEAGEYCDDLLTAIDAGLIGNADIAQWLRMQSGPDDGGSISNAIKRAITGSKEPVVVTLVNRFGKWLAKVAESVAKSTRCDHAKMVPLAIYHGLLKFVNQWFGVVPQAATNTLQQAENLVCQTKMPDQPSTDSAWLADEIKTPTWECWTQLNGSVVDAARVGLQTRRTRPDPLQWTRLFRRKQVSEQEWKDRVREDGVIKDRDRKAYFDLTQDWPTQSELLPWMVRDVWDEQNIDWTEVDKLFDAKFAGDAEDLFKAIGWTRELAKKHWRAHFHLPSFTMASEMYHRYRNRQPGDPLRTDLDKVRNLLIQDDWHPDWIDRMLAITFRPMRLIDLRNSYDLRVISDEQLKEKLQWLGYDDETVELTYHYWKRRREIRDAVKGGFPSVKQLISKYANCQIDDHTFRLMLSHVVETPEQEQYALTAAEVARQSEDNRRTIAGVEWQYRRGIITEEEATAHLQQGGIDPACIPSLVKTIKMRAQKAPKQLTAASMCRMLEYGIITPGEFISGLLRAGWTPQDAQRILASCQIGLTVKEMRRARAEADRLARDQRRLEREARRQQRLEECGPVPCPRNRQTASQNGAADQSNQDQT